MQNVCKQWMGWSKIRSRSGLIGLIIMLSIVAGCATGHKAGPQPGEETPVAAGKATVTRFGADREGFNITEHADMTSGSRHAFEQAVPMLEAGRYAEAIEILEKVIESSPGVTAPYINIAMAYRHSGQPEKAEKHLKTALKLVPGHPVASNEYGLLLRQKGRFAEAKTIFEKTLTIFPEYMPAHKNLGILCDLYLNDLDCAIEQYEIFGEAMPEDEQIPIWIADLRLRRGN